MTTFRRLAIAGSVDSEFGTGVEKAVVYFNRTEAAHPSLCARLELGYNWEDAVMSIISQCMI